MRIRNRTTDRMMVLALSVAFMLVGLLSAPLVAQEDDPEIVTMNEVAELFRSIGSSEELDQATIIEALESLSEGILDELEAQDVPEEAISRFNEEFGSALTLFREGLINRDQLGEEATGAAQRLGREVEGELPVELLKEKGINTEAIQKLKEGAETYTGEEVAEIARSIAGKETAEEAAAEEAQEKKEEAEQQAEEKKEEGQEKAEEKKEEAQEKKEEAKENSEEEEEEVEEEDEEEGEKGREKGESESEDSSEDNGRP